MSELSYEPKIPPKNYWENTSSNRIIREFIERDDFDVSPDFETLLNGGTVRKTIIDSLTYDMLYESEENLWSVLFMTGYLTKADPEETGSTVDLKIPNQEIAGIFAKASDRLSIIGMQTDWKATGRLCAMAWHFSKKLHW